MQHVDGIYWRGLIPPSSLSMTVFLPLAARPPAAGAALVAVYGFGVAAMWISLFAGEIVALLHFLGTLSGIDSGVLGLTVRGRKEEPCRSVWVFPARMRALQGWLSSTASPRFGTSAFWTHLRP